jgi:hypothetical protein
MCHNVFKTLFLSEFLLDDLIEGAIRASYFSIYKTEVSIDIIHVSSIMKLCGKHNPRKKS